MRPRGLTQPALAVLSTLLGCNADPGADNGKGIAEPAPLPVVDAGTTPAYPPPPYGVTQGATINDFSFQGFVKGQVGGAPVTLALSDFYNPHFGDASYRPAPGEADDRLFPPGSPHGAGTPKPAALLIDVASVWCGPCNEEAKNVLNGLYARYKPCGGEFLFQLAEGAAPGAPATEQLLETWITTYHVAYPAIWDPAKQLFPLYNADAFPDSAIVDTRTMQIVDVVSGVADTTFWSTFESHLDAACLAAQ